MKCEEIEVLISGCLDGELTQQEAQRVAVHVDACPGCRDVYEEVKRLKADMGGLAYPPSDEAVLARLEGDLLARGAGRLGWALLIVGFTVTVGAGLLAFFSDSEVPLLLRFFYGLFMLGGAALFVAVLRQRLLTYKNDKYRRVKL